MSPNAKIQERHFDYVWSLPPLLSGQPVEVPVQFDSDAPFVLRGLAARIPYDANGTQNGIQFVSMRYSGPTQDYRQQVRVPLRLLMGAYYGQYGNPKPVYPGVLYPANGTAWLDVVNDGPGTLTGLQVFFRGVKLGRWGQWSVYTYPAKMKSIPYAYPFVVPALGVTDSRDNQVFRVRPNGDFVLRAGQAGRAFLPDAWEVFLTLRDQSKYPYSNAPVHADVLFGSSLGRTAFPFGPVPGYVAPIGPGASAPGLIYPEVYLPADHLLLYDISRADAAYAGAQAVDYPINFIGSKVVAA